MKLTAVVKILPGLILSLFSRIRSNMGYLTVAGAIALLVVIQCTSVSACDYPTQYGSNYGKDMVLSESLRMLNKVQGNTAEYSTG